MKLGEMLSRLDDCQTEKDVQQLIGFDIDNRGLYIGYILTHFNGESVAYKWAQKHKDERETPYRERD